MNNRLLFILLLFAFISSAHSQTTIRGVVYDFETNEPLAGAAIKQKNSNKIVISSKDGSFTVTVHNGLSKELTISFIGYETKDVSLLTSQQEVIVTLKSSFTLLPDVSIQASSITGGSASIRQIPGSVTYISPKQLNTFNYSDPMRALKQVNGINIQEEDGFGLRPNIGMRGTGVERSSKITIMEDGVLMAPAPYAAPAAYYFPEFGRMDAVEVLKGSSQIKYGPYTNGGVINFISKPIPRGLGVTARFEMASRNSMLYNVMTGYGTDNFGFSIETFGRQSDGFKELDNGGNTGFNRTNWLLKSFGRFKTGSISHTISLKLGLTNENSNETYLGLTDDDFNKTPLRRYAGSQVDNMLSEHRLSQISYTAEFSKNLNFNLTAYHNTFQRNWYKLDKVTDSVGTKTGIGEILDNPEQFSNVLGILQGQNTSGISALHVKANNRTYYATGVQTQMNWYTQLGGYDQKLEVGIRYHQDQMDRFQWIDDYNMVDGNMFQIAAGTPGTESNRIETASAVASYLQYIIEFNRFKIIPGIRNEHINIKRIDYGKNDPGRVGDALSSRSNTVNVWIPGIGLHYDFSEEFTSFIGVHKGFSPPGSKEGTLPEESINYELGTQYQSNRLEASAILFFNDYSNLLGVDLNAGGGLGSNDLFNAGAARVYGLEASGRYDLLPLKSPFAIPVGFTYTYTIGQFKNNFQSGYEPWADVEVNDYMPYLPNHQLGLTTSIEYKRLALNLAAKYVSAMRTIAGKKEIVFEQSVPENFIIDFSAQYMINANFMVYGSIQNLTNEVYIVSRRPAGVRPGLPRWFTMGLRFML